MQADSFRSEKKKNFWISLMNARRKKYEPAFSVDVNHKTTKKLIHIFPSSPNNSNRKKEERSNEATMKTSARRGLSNCVRCEKRKKNIKPQHQYLALVRLAGRRADENQRLTLIIESLLCDEWVSKEVLYIRNETTKLLINYRRHPNRLLIGPNRVRFLYAHFLRSNIVM